MVEYVSVEQARGMSGLRVVLTPGGPAPWSEAIKGILHVKRLLYVKVAQETGANRSLQEWTAQTSAPVAIWNDERPRSLWNDQLFLLERLAPEPALIPTGIEERALMFGYSNEICGETGFAWNRRLMMVAGMEASSSEGGRKFAKHLGDKYGFEAEAAKLAPARVARIVECLAARLVRQRDAGSRFFIGNSLSALDIYWATFATLLQPLPQELCPMTPGLRRAQTVTDPQILQARDPILLEHRDFIYHDYLQLPMDF
jgi:glutathione S-transferase